MDRTYSGTMDEKCSVTMDGEYSGTMGLRIFWTHGCIMLCEDRLENTLGTGGQDSGDMGEEYARHMVGEYSGHIFGASSGHMGGGYASLDPLAHPPMAIGL